MEQVERWGMTMDNIEEIREDVRRICREDFIGKWKNIVPIELDYEYDYEQWEALFVLNYLRAYFRMFSEPKYSVVDKKILKRKIELFDKIIRTAKLLNGTNICKVKNIMCKFDEIRKTPLRDLLHFDEEPKVSYGELADQVMTFFRRTGEHESKSKEKLEIQINEQLLVPFILLAIIYKAFRLDQEGEWQELGESVKRHFYSTKRIEGCRMTNAVGYVLKCIAELLYYNQDVVDELSQYGFDVSADVGNCLCEETGFYDTDLMDAMEKNFIDDIDVAPVWDYDNTVWLNAISDVELCVYIQRLKKHTSDMNVGKKNDPERNYMGLIFNGFKSVKRGRELSDDLKPLYNRLLRYFKKDKDSVWDLFKRNSTIEEWEEILSVLPVDEAIYCSTVKMFKAICLVEFGLQYGGTLERPLFDLCTTTLFDVFTSGYLNEELDKEDVIIWNRDLFNKLCEVLPQFQMELQNSPASEVKKIFERYIGKDGKIGKKELTAMYFDPF